jgi:ABC-type transporter Mla subunit MlaD
MAYTTAQARQQVLDTVAQATEEIAFALASLSEAYEHLDEHNADNLEQELFRPVQMAYGRAKRTHAEFATRHGLPGRTFQPASPGAPSTGVKGFLDSAVDAVERADRVLATLQDSMLPVEVGDAELRTGLEDVRKLLSDLRGRARELVRTLGR